MTSEIPSYKKTLDVKLVLLGDSRVGKSSIVQRFIRNEFDQYKFPTIGATFAAQYVTLDNYLIKYDIWDTAGQEKYRSLASLYYKDTNAAIIVYDITDSESYENGKNWIKEVQTQEGKHVLIALVGNKLDLNDNRKVSIEDAQQYAKQNKFLFFETSAKNNINIKLVFKTIAEEIPHRKQPIRDNGLIIKEEDIINKQNKNNNKKCPCIIF